ncbi:hypothetical protein T4B_14322 [Trichinella pseudospiralis]|uniref:Uncharacterized protein n=1 Tax=Trichinella pseudospiralis TaxID=6337 RepID=A0A0V1DU48_TRIPS|nr:hypothetical protein T4A_1402 [Trichinella pseudospiralis]KRY70967.1 hypothetical protein T4A_11844 [Trichinella pseudospiralis]KRZ33821.1 hypothetical protein T4B_14322 [Trichinella pseudospiralis]KRZ44544.1 hypothetical protein T4C_151 [Trichinella pseudospiralis]
MANSSFVVGQSSSHFVSQCGPCHHKLLLTRSFIRHPLVKISAGLSVVGQCLHHCASVSSRMDSTLFPTKGFHL